MLDSVGTPNPTYGFVSDVIWLFCTKGVAVSSAAVAFGFKLSLCGLSDCGDGCRLTEHLSTILLINLALVSGCRGDASR